MLSCVAEGRGGAGEGGGERKKGREGEAAVSLMVGLVALFLVTRRYQQSGWVGCGEADGDLRLWQLKLK